jgi:DNA-binding GntR family transcriptional regulator
MKQAAGENLLTRAEHISYIAPTFGVDLSANLIRPEYRTRAQVILESLRDRISSGILPTGERLLLRTLSEEFGCSEIPVREALRTLQAEGFINVIPHIGSFVSAPNISELVELTEIRSILEPEATVRAAPHVDAQTLSRLRDLLAQMRKLAQAGASEECGRVNRRFHVCILERSPNQKMISLLKDLWGQADRARLVYRKGPEFLAESMRQHALIVDAIAQKDLSGLRQLVTDHCQYGLNAVRSLAAEAAAGSATAAVAEKGEI